MPQRKKPASEHKGNGTYKPSRHATPALRVEIPLMPPDMGPKAQATWNIVTKQLFEAGILSSIDMHSLRLLSEGMELYFDACDAVKKHGILIEQTNKGGFTNLVMNPAVRVRATAFTQVANLLNKFGMTPAARTGIPFDQPEAEDEEEAQIEHILGIHRTA